MGELSSADNVLIVLIIAIAFVIFVGIVAWSTSQPYYQFTRFQEPIEYSYEKIEWDESDLIQEYRDRLAEEMWENRKLRKENYDLYLKIHKLGKYAEKGKEEDAWEV